MNTYTLKQNQKNNTMKFNLLYKTRLQQKKIHCIIALFLCSIGLSLNAQTGYQSFFGDSSTTYHVFTSMTCYTHDPGILGCGGTWQLTINQQDTIIVHDTVYYKVRHLYVREDTIMGRIYRYFPDVKKEFLTCDMSLNVGDTFHLPVLPDAQGYFYHEAGTKLVVDSVAYINGKKVIYFPYIGKGDSPSSSLASHYFSGTYYAKYNIIPAFIEGIGPTFSPFVYAIPESENDMNVLLCVDKNDTLAFMLNEELGCDQSGVNVKEIENVKIQIFPNPANDHITLRFGNTDNIKGQIVITDMIGGVVYRNSIINNSMQLIINISSFSQGIYTLIFFNKKEKLILKFIKIIKN